MEDRFLAAVRAGDLDTVRQLLAHDPSLAAARNDQALSAVLLSCYRGHAEVRDALLAAAPPLDALELAAVGDAASLGERLAADPQALHARSPDGFTPLHYAAFFGGAEAVRVLLAAGAAADADADNAMRVRPLHSAAARGDREAVRALLAAGAEPNPRQNGGFTPLHAAAHSDDAELAELLLEHGADPAVCTDDGRDARALAGPRVAALLTRADGLDAHDVV
jgi:ankyrin repeat protein